MTIGGGVGAGFSYSWTLVDEQEGIACGDWSYVTDTGLGANRSPSASPLYEYQSGDYSESELPKTIHQFDGLLRAALKMWEKGSVVRGQYDISCAAYATDHCALDWARSRCICKDPTVSIENIGYSP